MKSSVDGRTATANASQRSVNVGSSVAGQGASGGTSANNTAKKTWNKIGERKFEKA